jgi:alpha-L-rhamnosidase
MKFRTAITLIAALTVSCMLQATNLTAQHWRSNDDLELVNAHGDLREWPAAWVQHAGGPVYEYGVFYFRKTVTLSDKPDSFVIHVSADNRYRLFVNGESVSSGPARGDLRHWRYETVDIAPQLKAGKNVLAAVVWNFGRDRPVYQVTNETAFIMNGHGSNEQIVNTGSNSGWISTQSTAYKPLDYKGEGYYVVGPGADIDGAKYLWGWNQPEFDDSGWQPVRSVGNGRAHGKRGRSVWELCPRPIPLMLEEPRRFATVRRQDGALFNDAFLKGNAPIIIPANTKTTVLIDNAVLTTAYPELITSGGTGASVTVWYAEGLFDKNKLKGNRNEIEGKTITGNYDIFRPEGGDQRMFRPLFWRTFRYVRLDIETGSEPLTLNDYRHVFTTYPFDWSAKFESDRDDLQDIWDVGIRTLQLCAFETFVDCPYYEQLQYVGDTRNETLTSYYLTGDDRLGRNAIILFDDSRIAEGITHSRYPSAVPQFIPGFSLEWVKMLYDFYWYRNDAEFVRNVLPGTRTVLAWFQNKLDDSDFITTPDWWPYVDWAWPVGHAPMDEQGRSAIFTLSYADALRKAAAMEAAMGKRSLAVEYRRQAQRCVDAVRSLCWSEERGLLADTPARDSFSQHVNIWGVLTGAVPVGREQAVMQTVIDDKSLTQASYYYQYFYHLAVRKAGLAEQYLDLLQPWYDMLDIGLTTWAETGEPDVRSDCHAWSSHPNFHLLATVAGIESAAPGFQKVRIAPVLGELKNVNATMPHPAGTVEVNLQRVGNTGIAGSVSLPEGISGIFEWQGQTLPLQQGKQDISIP